MKTGALEQVVAFDPRKHVASGDVTPGTPVRISRPGWKVPGLTLEKAEVAAAPGGRKSRPRTKRRG